MKTEMNNENQNEMGVVATADPVRESFLTLPLGSLMVKNALPAVASMLFMALYQAMDGILVGRRLGPEALASVNILYPILAVFIGLAIMIGVGGNARIAVLLGAGETKRASQTLGLIVVLGVMLGIAGSVIIRIFFPQILAVLGTTGVLGTFAGQYLRAMYPFFATMILFFILEQSLRNDGRAGMATSVMAAMAMLNILLNYLFLFPLNLGISGAALATGISQTLGALIFMTHFIRKTMDLRPGLCFAAPRGGMEAIRAIAMNGSSELFNSLAVGLTTFLFNRLIISYVGALGVAAFSVTQYFLTVGMMVFTGLGNGAQPILSYNHGAGLTHRVQGTLVRLLASSLAVGMLCFVIMRFQAETLAGLFIPDHPGALEATLRVAATVSWSMLFIPVGIVVSTFFTALEKTENSLIVAVCRGFIFTLLGLAIFPQLWGEAGIWITPVFAEGATVLVAGVLVYRWQAKEQPSEVRICCEVN